MKNASIGKFLAGLRKKQGLTQEQLAEELGVTGKTISRWETGVYLPPLEMLQALSQRYGLTVDELLNGCQSEKTVKAKSGVSKSAFTYRERMAYYQEKWRGDHHASLIMGIILLAALLIAGLLGGKWLLGIAAVLGCVFRIVRYNRMMAYAEWKTYVEPHCNFDKEKL